MLKPIVKDLAEAPEGARPYYVARDGSYFLDVEGKVDKARLDEMRAHNIAANNELTEWKARFEGIDPVAVKALMAEKAKLEAEAAGRGGDVEKVVSARLKAAETEWQKKLDSATAERDQVRERLERGELEGVVLKEGAALKVRASAIPDLLGRARGVFRFVDGQPRAFEADGKTVRLGRDGVAPLGLAEWVGGLLSEAPHLFEGNAGGGAAGTGAGGAGGRKNPFRRGAEWNLTEQMRLLQSDPGLAASLRASAG